MEISKIIKEARIKKGMTQQQLADSDYFKMGVREKYT